jgi:hypothetical protein
MNGVALAAIILLATPLSQVHPQSWRPAALTGTVRDPGGHPVVNVAVRIGAGPDVHTDSLGRYAFPAVPAGSWRIMVLCPSASYWHAQRLAVFAVELQQSSSSTQNATVDRTRCRAAAPDTLRGQFRGHWSVGFEESRFVPCPGTIDSARVRPDSDWIWGKWADGAEGKWPEPMPAPDSSGYGNRYYVEARALLHGPGDFGHLGVAAYQLEVERLIQVRTPTPDDCR